jgi:endoglycosylceramidase
MKAIYPVAAAAWLALAATCAVADIMSQAPISVNSQQRLIDMYGREVVFHGANVVVKGFPWIPSRDQWSWDDSFVAEDMQVMRDLGLNAIRLGTMWPGAEPKQGEYNMTYVQALADLVAEASTYGIYSLMDMHQDVLSEKFCGEGVPNWAAISNVSNFPWPLQGEPFNSTAGLPNPYDQCAKFNWAEYYPTQATGQAFQNLYTNAFGLRDAWANFWVQVATAVRGLGAAVLGYELINEPWAGDMYQDILWMIPGEADKVNLQPAYEHLQAAIRAVDPEHAIFFEGATWDWFEVGFTQVPGGDVWQNKSVLSYHFYIPPDFSVDVQFAARAKDMQRLGCGGMLTEFGVQSCNGCGTLEMGPIMDKCDSMMQSWLFWELKPFAGAKTGSSGPLFFSNGSMNEDMAFNFSRTYAQAVGGVTQIMAFNVSTGNFTLVYTTSQAVWLPQTVIYASQKYHYPRGMNIAVSPLLGVNYTVTNNTVTVTHDPTQLPSGTTIHVDITPK